MIDKKFVLKVAEDCIQELDNSLYIVELTVSSSNSISVELDKDIGNVSIEECVAVSRSIEHSLNRDENDFDLQVSSAGLSQPLRNIRQFHKNIGKEVEVKFNDGKKLEGKMLEATENELQISHIVMEKEEGKKKKVKKEIIEKVDRSTIKEVKVVIQFK